MSLPAPSPPQATPLFLACLNGVSELAVLLLSKGADPNLPAINSKAGSLKTPLWFAAKGGALETVRELLRHGARLDRGGQNFVFKCTN